MDTQTNDGCYFELAVELGFIEDAPIRPNSRRREDIPPISGYIPFTMWNDYRTGFAMKSQELERALLSGEINCRSFVEAQDELKSRFYEVEDVIELI